MVKLRKIGKYKGANEYSIVKDGQWIGHLHREYSPWTTMFGNKVPGYQWIYMAIGTLGKDCEFDTFKAAKEYAQSL